MKNFLILVPLSCLLSISSSLCAQNVTVPSTQDDFGWAFTRGGLTSHPRDLVSSTSNEYWFAIPQNYVNQGGKRNRLYISSPYNTNCYIEGNGFPRYLLHLYANEMAAFDLPINWELESSDYIENKGIHVWSDDAPLIVELHCFNPSSSDATTILPPSGWGTIYVVASYSSFPDHNPSFDFPSEFVMVADADSTIVNIKPAADIKNNLDSTVQKAGKSFTVMLQRGQCVQYKAAHRFDTTGLDLTGTVLRANHPIGVIGANQCALIPAIAGYCEFICEMIPPVRTWGKNYYTAPLVHRRGGDVILLIGSKDSQKIFRANANGKQLICQLTKQYDFYWDVGDTQFEHWTSDAPFMTMQYSSGANNPDGSPGIGGPFMMAVNPFEQFSTPVDFNVPMGVGNTDYRANIAVVTRHGEPVFLDSLNMGLPIFDDGEISIYEKAVKNIHHRVTSDSGVSINIQEDLTYDAIGFAASFGVNTLNSLDKTPPAVSLKRVSPYNMQIDAKDIVPVHTGISRFQINRFVNARLVALNGFVEGSGVDSASALLQAYDTTLPAYASVSVYDLAGNYTTFEARSFPQKITPTSEAPYFGYVYIGDSSSRFVRIINTTSTSDTVYRLNWIPTNFSIDTTKLHLPLVIAPHSIDSIRVTFRPVVLGLDTSILVLEFGSNGSGSVLLAGSGISSPNGVGDKGSASPQSTRGFSILGIAPNPGKDNFSISYYVGHGEKLQAALFDVLGNKIFDFSPGFVDIGIHTISCDTRQLIAGTYLVRLQSTGNIESRRVTVVR